MELFAGVPIRRPALSLSSSYPYSAFSEVRIQSTTRSPRKCPFPEAILNPAVTSSLRYSSHGIDPFSPMLESLVNVPPPPPASGVLLEARPRICKP